MEKPLSSPRMLIMDEKTFNHPSVVISSYFENLLDEFRLSIFQLMPPRYSLPVPLCIPSLQHFNHVALLANVVVARITMG